MSNDYDHGPIQTYEVIWQSGHVERIKAHQVLWPDLGSSLFGVEPKKPPRVLMHAEIDGHWRLMLSAPEEDIRSIRNVTSEELLAS